MRSLILCSFLVTGCAPTLVEGVMPNPAKSADKIAVAQTYEIGPYKENHQFELGLSDWTASSINLRVKLTNIDECGDPKRFTYTLVDDQGMKSGLRANDGEITSSKQPGKANQTVTIREMTGVFPIAIAAGTQSLLVQMRPVRVNCPALDFKWTLQ